MKTKVRSSVIHAICCSICFILFVGLSILIQFSILYIFFAGVFLLLTIALIHSPECAADDWRLVKRTNTVTGEIYYVIQYLYLGDWFKSSDKFSIYEADKLEEAKNKVKQLKGLQKIKEEVVYD